jgi:hypothetical protein
MQPLIDALVGWLREHPDRSVTQLVVDLRDVDYRSGDAPISCLVPFLREGIEHVRYIAADSTAAALESLITMTKMQWFSVERVRPSVSGT